ncbi:MAG: thioredoxin family protein [Acidobacteria bacterium]|nr:thioredoxin family protein [Acidobacteriota bacterium]
MKIIFASAILVFAVFGPLYAQKTTPKKNLPPKMAAPAAPVKKTRELFDPKRDPAADLAAAVIRAQKENKRIILDVGGEWCSWCVRMDNYFLENPALARLRDRNFIWVKINFSPENENRAFLSKYPEVTGYPFLFVLEKDGSLLHAQPTNELEESIIVQSSTTMSDPQEIRKRLREKDYDLYNFVSFLKTWALY